MRRVSLTVMLAVVAAAAAGCSQSSKPTADTGTQKGVQGKYYYVNLFSPPVGGIITSDVGGINCGVSARTVNNTVTPPVYVDAYYTTATGLSNKCGQTRFDWSQTVVLTATPMGGNSFLTWAADCTGATTCNITAGPDRTVVALFGAAGSFHPNFTSPTVHGPAFFASIAGTSALKCSQCHGANYDGRGIAPSCTACHAAAGKPNWLADCTFCHAAPPASRSHQFVAAGDLTACAACHPTTVTATGAIVAGGTHMNGVVDDAFSSGGRNCATCHGALMGDSTSYHHVMGALADGWTTYPANPQPTTAADKACVQCHVDHDLFTATRGANLRSSILAVTASNQDGAICTSCHGFTQTKDYSGQKDDATRGTYAIDATAFWAGGHGFLVGGSITGAGFDFQVACTKCHNSEAATQFQDGAYRFGLHTSGDRRLRALLGRAGGTDDDAEDFCFRCHSLTTDAVGGAAKSDSQKDWYGVQAMPNGSTGVFAQMMGTPAKPTTLTDTLYFKPSTEEVVTGTGPSAGSAETGNTPTSTLYLTNAAYPQTFGYQLATGTYNNTVVAQNAMSLTGVAATATTTTLNTVSGTTAYDRIAQWISPPLASGFTWTSGNITLYIYRQESNSNNNCYFRYAAYKLSGGVLTPVITSAQASSEFSTTAGIQNFSMAVIANSSFAVGDQLVVELEAYKNAPTSTGTCTVTYGNTAVDQSRLVLPATAAGSFPEFAGAPSGGGAWTARSMSPFLPAAANETITGTGSSTAFAAQLWQRASFVSVPLAVSASIPAGTWALSIAGNRGSFSSSQAYWRYRLYAWTAGNAKGADIVPWTTYSGSSLGSSTGTISINAAGAAASLSAGDKVVVELEVESMNTTTSVTANANLVFGSSNASSVKAPAAMTFTYTTPAVVPTVGHLGQAYTGIHRPNPAEETLARIAVAKHAECSDCHDAHGARRGNQADGGTATAATATTLTDSSQAWLPNAWVGYSIDVTSGTGAGGRAMITANDATTLTFGTLATAPVAGSGYRVSMKSNGGAVTAATANSLTDGQTAVGGAKAWATDAFAGWTVRIVLGTGVGQTKAIASNSATTLVLAGAWDTLPDTTSRYVVDKLPGVLAGAGGVNVTAWDAGSPTSWNETKTLVPAPGSTAAIPAAKTQWQVCFKCHSAANTAVTTWKTGWTDLAAEFNPRNQSYHPVMAPAAAFAATGYGSTQITSTNVINGWKVGDVMYCSDCHGNTDTGYGASQGPHASASSYMLRGPNTRWPFQANGTSRWTTSNYTTGQGTKDGLFCLNCHTLSSVHTRSDHSGLACTQCHILIPHGGKVRRLMATMAYAGAPAVTYNNRGLWTASTAYAVNDYVNVSGTSRYYRCTVAGTSGTTAPTGTGSSTYTDGSVSWRYSSSAPTNVAAIDPTSGTPAPYLDTGVQQVLRAYAGGTSSSNCNAGCSGPTSTEGGHGTAVNSVSAW